VITTSNIMDKAILEAVRDIPRSRLFDYGCGYTDLTQKLALTGHEVAGFDISDEVVDIQKKKDNPYGIRFLTNSEFLDSKGKMEESFDIVISSLVLCVISNLNEVNEIMKDMTFLLKPEGWLVVGICNPLYTFHNESEVQKKIIPPGRYYHDYFKYSKIVKSTGRERIDYHRPLGFYESLFSNHGFKIIETIQTPGTSPSGEFVSDFIIFKCIKEG